MKTSRPAILSAILVALLCPALPGQQKDKEQKAKELYPLRLGSRWTYQSGDKEVVLRLKAVENVGTIPCASLETKRDDGLALSEWIAYPPAVAPDGLYRVKLGVGNLSLPLDPPLCFAKLKASKRTEWKIESRLGGPNGERIEGAAVQDEEEVRVPLGTFKAVRVEVQLKRGDQTITITSHFAPGVGMVKQVQTVAGKQTVLELLRYDEGK